MINWDILPFEVGPILLQIQRWLYIRLLVFIRLYSQLYHVVELIFILLLLYAKNVHWLAFCE